MTAARLLAPLALSLAAGCVQRGPVLLLEGGDAGAPGDAAAPMPWGEYAATLDVPPCPTGATLVVDTTADELDGGTGIADPAQAGPALSLVEALWIAANRLGQDNIYFDPDVFPAASPATILLSSTTQPPSFASPVCIDGRGRGVVVDWNAVADGSGTLAIWRLGAGDLQVGLTLLRAPYEQVVLGARVAGCRHGTDGDAVLLGARPWPLELHSGTIGPGNVFAGTQGVRAYAGAITGNYFGYDPLSQTALDLDVGINVESNGGAAELVAEGNLFINGVGGSAVVNNWGGALTFRDNLVDGGELGIVMTSSSHGSVIGPGNVIRGCGTAIGLSDADALITRNRIFGNTQGIYVAPPAPVAPPTIVSTTATEVNGLCAVAGTVEVFSDASDQGEWFLGSVACDGVTPWTLGPLSVPSGRNVTATLTDAANRTSAFSEPARGP